MKQILLLCLTVHISSLICCQTIEYAYDDSGNRESRITILLKSASANQEQTSEETVISEQAGKYNVMIFPNPVKSELTINIVGLNEDIKVLISVFDQAGHSVLLFTDYNNGNNLIDLSNLLPGIYYMLIQVDRETIKVKLVKE
jgi:hypothetical protein